MRRRKLKPWLSVVLTSGTEEEDINQKNTKFLLFMGLGTEGRCRLQAAYLHFKISEKNIMELIKICEEIFIEKRSSKFVRWEFNMAYQKPKKV